MKLATVTILREVDEKKVNDWLENLEKLKHPDVLHIVFNFSVPSLKWTEKKVDNFLIIRSIGEAEDPYYLFVASYITDIPWLMNLPPDSFPHNRFFDRLLSILEKINFGIWLGIPEVRLRKEAWEEIGENLPIREEDFDRFLKLEWGEDVSQVIVARRIELLRLGGGCCIEKKMANIFCPTCKLIKKEA